jgi:hypothetical protein
MKPEWKSQQKFWGIGDNPYHRLFPFEELNRYAVDFANSPFSGPNNLSPHFIQSGYLVSC